MRISTTLKMQPLLNGTEIYYGGDMANDSGFGVISEVVDDKWGLRYNLKMEDGRTMLGIHHCAFDPIYLGHGGTRFVTKEAYKLWREAGIKQMEADFSAMQAARNTSAA